MNRPQRAKELQLRRPCLSVLIVVTVAMTLVLTGCGSDGDDFSDAVDERAEHRETALLVMLATKDDLRGRDGEPMADELDTLMADVDLVEWVKEDRLQDLIDYVEHNSRNADDVLSDLVAELEESSD